MLSSRLAAASPGTMTAPSLPPFMSPAYVVASIPPAIVVALWQTPHLAAMTAPMFASKVGLPVRGAGMGVGTGVGICACRISRSFGASNPAYVNTVPWHALLEQKDVLLVPPGSAVEWHAAHVLSMDLLCRLIQLALRCDSGSGPRLISTFVTKSWAPATTGTEWQRLHSSRMACWFESRCLPS